jgi:hypothetical protein
MIFLFKNHPTTFSFPPKALPETQPFGFFSALKIKIFQNSTENPCYSRS